MSKSETKKLPAFRIYGVSKNANGESRWAEIGAAWKHRDGNGLNLSFSARPLEGAERVLRTPKPPTAQPKKKSA